MSAPTRRAFVGAGLTAAAVAGVAGLAAGFVTTHRPGVHRPVTAPRGTAASTPSDTAGKPSTPSPPVPDQTPIAAAALQREQSLLERLDAAARAAPSLRTRISVLQADHRAHSEALRALIGAGAPPTGGSGAAAPPSTAAPRAATLASWESAAAAAAAKAALGAGTELAPLLASISACEASHAAWLT